jgi:hypothetical protein
MRMARRAVLVLAVVVSGCKSGSTPDGGGSTDASTGTDAGNVDSGLPLPALTGTLVDHTFHVAEHMRASREMQVSGEPFAQILGYNLNNFDRQLVLTTWIPPPASTSRIRWATCWPSSPTSTPNSR